MNTTPTLNKTAIKAFLKANPDFQWQIFKFHQEDAVKNLVWPTDIKADQQPHVVTQLKALQRLVRLTDNLEVAEKLYDAGFHSAAQIASLSVEEFTAQAAACFQNDSKESATNVHQKAHTLKAQSVLTYTALNQHTGAHYRGSRFNNLSALTDQAYQGLPDYGDLFGNTDYCECEKCRSILSPAAYFADLMRFQNAFITPPSGSKNTLKDRRPDLWTMKLSCENTNTQVSKISIVNKLLAQTAGLPYDAKTNTFNYEPLATSVYPFNLPFHLPLTQIRTYLSGKKTSLADIWERLSFGSAKTPSISLETLGLSKEQWTLYSTDVSADSKKLTSYYGLPESTDLVTYLSSVTNFLKQTSLTPAELNDLLFEDLSDAEIEAKINSGFFINAGKEAPITINDDKLNNLTLLRLDHINRLVRLAQALGWSFTDLNWALTTLAPTGQEIAIKDELLAPLSLIYSLHNELNLPIIQICAWISNLRDKGLKNGPTFFQQIFNSTNIPNPPAWSDKLIWTVPETGQDLNAVQKQIQNALVAALKISQNELLLIAGVMLKAKNDGKRELPLNIQNLSVLYRLSQISLLTQFSIQESLILLTLPGMPVDLSKQIVSNKQADVLKAFYTIKDAIEWIEDSNISPADLQYILEGKSLNLKLQNSIIEADVVANFIQGLKDAMSGAYFIKQVFVDNVKSLFQSENILGSMDKAWDIFTKGSKPLVDNDGIITEVPDEKSLIEALKELKLTQEVISLLYLTLSNYYQLQQQIFNQRLASLYGLSPQLMPALKVLTGLSLNKKASRSNIHLFVGKERQDNAIGVPYLQTAVEGPSFVTSSSVQENPLRLSELQLGQRYATLLKTLSLSPAEIQSIIENPEYYGVTFASEKTFLFDLNDIQNIYLFKALVVDLRDTQNRLLGYFDAVKKNPNNQEQAINTLASLTAWDPKEVGFLFKNLNKISPMGTFWYGTVQGIHLLTEYFNLSKQLKIEVSALYKIAKLNQNPGTYAEVQTVAQEVWAGLQELNTDQNLQLLENAIDEQKRTALLRLAMVKLNAETPRDLYTHLLLDVEVSGIVQTTPITEAIFSVQLYIQRCRNHLEKDFTCKPEVNEWWPWIENYRAWEANREIFLYPENYIQPELRSQKTPLFTQLINDLKQADLKDISTVDTAYRNYMQGFAKIADVEIVGSALAEEHASSDDKIHYKNICFIGRSHQQPYTYSYRTALFSADTTQPEPVYSPLEWQPWQEINLQIKAEGPVTTLFAFGKWYIFWVEQAEGAVQRQTDSTTSQPQYQASIYYSSLEFNRSWSAPQQLGDSVPLAMSIQEMTSTGRSYWDRVYPTFFSSTKTIICPYGHNPLTRAFSLGEFELPIAVQEFRGTMYMVFAGTDKKVYIASSEDGINWSAPSPSKAGWTSLTRISLGVFKNIFYVCGHKDGKCFLSATKDMINWSSNLLQNVGWQTNNPLTLAEFNNKFHIVHTGSDRNIYTAYSEDGINWPSGPTIKDPKAISVTLVNFKDQLFLFYVDDNTSIYRSVLQKDGNWSNPACISLTWKTKNPVSFATYLDRLYISIIGIGESNIHISSSEDGYTWEKDQVLDASSKGSTSCLLYAFKENLCYIGTKDKKTATLTTINRNNRIFKIGESALSKDVRLALRFSEETPIAQPFDTLNSGFSTSQDTYYYDFRFGALEGIPNLACFSLWGKISSLPSDMTIFFQRSKNFGVNVSSSGDIFVNSIKVTNKPLKIGEAFHLVVNKTSSGTFVWLNGEKLPATGLASFDATDFYLGTNNVPFKGVMQEVIFYSRTLSDKEIVSLYNNSKGHIIENIKSYLSPQKEFLPFVSILPILQQPNWYIATGDNAEFLITPYVSQNNTLAIAHRLNTTVPHSLSQRLFTEGLKGLLTIPSQETEEVPFLSLINNTGKFPESLWPKNTIDFISGAMCQYYWEVFFHAPFLIANELQSQQQYEASKGWYEYIFNPTIDQSRWDLDKDDKDINDKYWRFLGLRSFNNPILRDELNRTWADEIKFDVSSTEQLYAYHQDPFNPHAIARLRPIAYQKTILMHYLDNLLKWGDNLFRRYTAEDLVDATMLYIEVYELLGKSPVNLGLCKLPKAEDYTYIQAHYKDEFLIKFEQLQTWIAPFNLRNTPHNYIEGAYFGFPENGQFIAYWKQVEQRLYNIRHGLNIDGIAVTLPSFQDPLDIKKLIEYVGSGVNVGSLPTSSQVTVPYYRFEAILQKAKEVTQTVMQLGQSLLSALEKKDAEALSRLYTTNQQQLAILTQTSKQDQLESANYNYQSLQAALQNAQYRMTHYSRLLSQGLSSAETADITLQSIAIATQLAAQVVKGLAIPGYMLPKIYGFAFGGMQFGEAINQGGLITEGIASNFGMQAGLSATVGSYQRRAEDWELQKIIAENDIVQLQYQLVQAQYQQHLAQQDIILLNKNIEQDQKVESFLKSKFTNQDLYQWMVGKLGALYYQAYQLAYELGIQAQQAWQFERGTTATILGPTYWDSLHQGLLSGESLLLDLQRMENAYMKRNQRTFEIEKTVSLAQLNPQALIDLREKGSCTFEFQHQDFYYDYRDHYRLQIKTISVSFPAIVGPYQNVRATLTQTSNEVLLQDEASVVSYLFNRDPSKTPSADILRRNYCANQQIALSQDLNDNGLFTINFNDERYLPFEGTGAVSSWTLSMPKETNPFDFASLTDVIVRLKYTAMSAKRDFTDEVNKLLKTFEGCRILSLTQEFSTAWNGFIRAQQPLEFVIGPSLFRKHLTNYKIGDVKGNNKLKQPILYMQLTKKGQENPFPTDLALQLKLADNLSCDIKFGSPQQGGVEAVISLQGPFDITEPATWILTTKSDQTKFMNTENIRGLYLVLPYTGDFIGG